MPTHVDIPGTIQPDALTQFGLLSPLEKILLWEQKHHPISPQTFILKYETSGFLCELKTIRKLSSELKFWL